MRPVAGSCPSLNSYAFPTGLDPGSGCDIPGRLPILVVVLYRCQKHIFPRTSQMSYPLAVSR